MKKIILLLLIAITACKSKNEINYNVSKSERNGKPSLRVSMQFKANPSGETVLLLQDKAWGGKKICTIL